MVLSEDLIRELVRIVTLNERCWKCAQLSFLKKEVEDGICFWGRLWYVNREVRTGGAVKWESSVEWTEATKSEELMELMRLTANVSTAFTLSEMDNDDGSQRVETTCVT